MMDDTLQRIQSLQFTDRGKAEALLLSFIQDTYSKDAAAVELRPLPTSLNSFNGHVMMRDGRRLFFKTHTEQDTVIGEYYNADLLYHAGYPIIRPVFGSTETGKQLLIYELVEDRSVFDVAWAIETGAMPWDDNLERCQFEADTALYDIYRRTLRRLDASKAASAPIHQLFYHRLTGGRLERFYGNIGGSAESLIFDLPGHQATSQDVLTARWIINDQAYDSSLSDLIASATRLLDPNQDTVAVVGHGDAHNGNVFFRHSRNESNLVYFDPAFAGYHHPLLDLAKPLFHNVFAMWMYFPSRMQANTSIDLERRSDRWIVRYDYALHSIRQMFLSSKVDRVLVPILRHLKGDGLLQNNWREYLKAGLFCCPFLTMNLTDSMRFPPEIALLGLCMSIEMGAESLGRRSLIDSVLDNVEQSL
jgi:hypothetical protein